MAVNADNEVYLYALRIRLGHLKEFIIASIMDIVHFISITGLVEETPLKIHCHVCGD